SSSSPCSWAEFAEEIFREAARVGLIDKAPRVLPIASESLPRAAARPAWSVLDCRRIEEVFGIRPKPWRDELRHVIRHLNELPDASTAQAPSPVPFRLYSQRQKSLSARLSGCITGRHFIYQCPLGQQRRDSVMNDAVGKRVGISGTGMISHCLVRLILRHYPQLKISRVLTRRSIATLADFPAADVLTHSVDDLIDHSDIIVECTGDVGF